MRGRLDVLGQSKTHLFGQVVAEGGNGSECDVWESVKGGQCGQVCLMT